MGKLIEDFQEYTKNKRELDRMLRFLELRNSSWFHLQEYKFPNIKAIITTVVPNKQVLITVTEDDLTAILWNIKTHDREKTLIMRGYNGRIPVLKDIFFSLKEGNPERTATAIVGKYPDMIVKV